MARVLYTLVFFAAFLLVDSQALSETLRVAGEYKVSSIKRQADGAFEVGFVSKHTTGRFDRLRLVTDHLHLRLKVGLSLKISAEIVEESGAIGEISQVLVFLRSSQHTQVPIWLISKTFGGRPLKGARYLEMHAPTSDYLVL